MALIGFGFASVFMYYDAWHLQIMHSEVAHIDSRVPRKLLSWGIDHDYMNIHAGNNFKQSALALTAWGLPPDLAHDIVRRAYWLNSDAICKRCCNLFDCCHVLGYEDLFGAW